MKMEANVPKRGRMGIRGQIVLLLILVFSLSLPAWAADRPYPEKPVKAVVPWAAGSTGDLGPREIMERMPEFLGQPVVAENKPGGGGIVGTALVAKTKPDGYTVLAASSSPLLLAPILKKVDYQTDDFIHAMVFGKTANWLAVKPDARWKNLKEFIDEEKKFPGKLKVSSYGKQTPGEFIIDLVSKYEGIKLTLIPYKSSGEALTPLLGGHVDAAIVSGSTGLLEAGSIRMLAVAEENRLPGYLDVPTFKELGYPIVTPPGRYWFCFPKGTPKEAVDQFSKAQENAMKRYGNEIRERLKRIEMWTNFLNREETVIQLKKDADMYLKVVKELGAAEK